MKRQDRPEDDQFDATTQNLLMYAEFIKKRRQDEDNQPGLRHAHVTFEQWLEAYAPKQVEQDVEDSGRGGGGGDDKQPEPPKRTFRDEIEDARLKEKGLNDAKDARFQEILKQHPFPDIDEMAVKFFERLKAAFLCYAGRHPSLTTFHIDLGFFDNDPKAIFYGWSNVNLRVMEPDLIKLDAWVSATRDHPLAHRYSQELRDTKDMAVLELLRKTADMAVLELLRKTADKLMELEGVSPMRHKTHNLVYGERIVFSW